MSETIYVKENSRGGLDPTDDASLARARATDLITLPPSVPGTNCANCLWVKPRKTNVSDYWCAHQKVDLPVTPRMCCALWDNQAVKRSWE